MWSGVDSLQVVDLGNGDSRAADRAWGWWGGAGGAGRGLRAKSRILSRQTHPACNCLSCPSALHLFCMGPTNRPPRPRQKSCPAKSCPAQPCPKQPTEPHTSGGDISSPGRRPLRQSCRGSSSRGRQPPAAPCGRQEGYRGGPPPQLPDAHLLLCHALGGLHRAAVPLHQAAGRQPVS